MRVVEVATTCSPAEVLREYAAAYEELHGLTEEAVLDWAGRVRDAPGVRGDMQVSISIVNDEISTGGRDCYSVGGVSPATPEDRERYAESGLPPPADEISWSLSFTPWGEWREMQVLDRTGQALTTDQLAAHLLYEMTWYGWPEKNEELRDELEDRMGKLERDFKDWKQGDPLPDGYHGIEKLIDGLNKDSDD